MARIKTHPGRILRQQYIETNVTTMTELARACGVNPSTLSRVLAEKSAISPELAFRLEVALGKSAEFWLHLQIAYDLSVVQANRKTMKNHPQHLVGLDQATA